jgi:hypothetical protein
VIYETFLFTRNQKRDFTAFIRPKDLTNKEISIIASALNNVNNIADLTPDWPAFYSFGIGQYNLLLRHYDSGRTHAGRNIGVVEGIAVRRPLLRHYMLAVPHFLARHDDVLAIAAHVPDVEALTLTESGEHDWPDMQAEEATVSADDELINEFVGRLAEDRLFVPFTQDGRALLISALSDPRLRTAYFAFGTNSHVIARLNEADVDVDIVSYFITDVPSLRNRQSNEITSELADFVSRLPARPSARQPESEEGPTADLLTPRQMRQHQKPRLDPLDDPLAKYDAGEESMLTPREMARLERKRQAEAEAAEQQAEVTRGWLAKLIARLLGRG